MFTAPSTFRVIAIISTYNEEDIIVPVVKHLIKEGISVYIIDNWSTDRTWELVNKLSPSLIGLERFPKDGPSPTYDWEDILKRKEELSLNLCADWFMHHDADEIRESPWPGVALKDAIYLVDQQGYNVVDFELLNFHPVDNNFQPGEDPKEYFQYFQFNTKIYDQPQEKAWKNTGQKVEFGKYAGHLVDFSGKKIFPYKFIIRHYPIRSQQHGIRKVFNERYPRFNPSEKQKQWHIQYDDIKKEYNFLKNSSDLARFHEGVYIEMMIHKLIRDSNEIKQLTDKITTREQSIQHLYIVLEERDQSIQHLTSDLAERIQTIQHLTSDLAERDQSIQHLTSDLAEREHEILFYANSKSWRYTRPVRKIMKLIKRIK